MQNTLKHIGLWLLLCFGGIGSIYVAAQVSSVSIDASIGSFIQYIGSIFVTQDGTPNGQTIFSVDSDGVSMFDLDREEAGPGLIGLNSDGRVVTTRPLSYVTLPDSPDAQQLYNNHAYIVPYRDQREVTSVSFPSDCVVGDAIDIHALKFPIHMYTDGTMKIVAPYLEGDNAGYGYGNNLFVEYDNYDLFKGISYNEYCDSGIGPDYPYDWCDWVRDEDEQTSFPTYGNGENIWGYEPESFPVRTFSFLCIDEYKYLMTADPIAINTPGDGVFYDIGLDSGYGDEFGQGYPDPFSG